MIKLRKTALGSVMPRSKSPLWLSGTLLVLVYVTFGWLAVTWRTPQIRWGVLLMMTLIVDIMSIYPDRFLNILFKGVFGAEARSLFLVMALATMTVLILTWLPIFSHMLLLLAAALLFSLDINELGIGRWQMFWLLVICQLMGLGLGFGGRMAWFQAVHFWPSLQRMG